MSTSSPEARRLVSFRKLAALGLVAGFAALGGAGCSSMPKVKHKTYTFPSKRAFVNEKVTRPFYKINTVRSKAEYTTLDPDSEEQNLCKNYFNKAVRDLVRIARKHGADAVVDVQSVVFTADGKFETYPRAECVDDGDSGQVLVIGMAVKWLPRDPALAERARKALAEKYRNDKPRNELMPDDAAGPGSGKEDRSRYQPSPGEEEDGDRIEIYDPRTAPGDKSTNDEGGKEESSSSSSRSMGAPSPFGGPVYR